MREWISFSFLCEFGEETCDNDDEEGDASMLNLGIGEAEEDKGRLPWGIPPT